MVYVHGYKLRVKMSNILFKILGIFLISQIWRMLDIATVSQKVLSYSAIIGNDSLWSSTVMNLSPTSLRKVKVSPGMHTQNGLWMLTS